MGPDAARPRPPRGAAPPSPAAVARGTSYGTPTEPEVELAEEIVARTPVERVRLVSSGTEATMSAIRLARGFTGRDVVVKFAGCYHGHVDALLASAGSGLATFAVPGTPGVPESSTALTLVLPYNDRAAVEAAFAEHGDRIACLITEAAPGNMGVVPPEPGFNAFLAETCAAPRRAVHQRRGDDRLPGQPRPGQWGLDGAAEGWRPDLMTFGKVMGGGFPAAAFGGRADVMALLAPDGPVYQAGTLSGNPVATTAGLATLRLATDDVYAHLTAAGDTLKPRPPRRSPTPGCRTSIQSAGTMFSVFLTDRPVRDFADASRTDVAAYAAFFHAMLDAGVYLPPSAYEAWFVSAAHDDRAVQTVLDALPGAARAARRSRGDRPMNPACRNSRHHRPPAAPRRGAQPRRRALRPPRRVPPLRPRPADGREGRRLVQRPRHRAPGAPRRSSGPRRPPRRWRRPAASRSSSTSGSSSPTNMFEGITVRRRRQRAAQPAALAAPLQPVAALVGRALQGDRRRG